MKTLVARLLVVAALSACNADRPCSSGAPGCDPDTGDAIVCGVTSSSFPMFDKACRTVDDCSFGVHQSDCCGSTEAIGMARAEQARFAADEMICVAQYPMCACPSYFTLAEDGQRAIDGKTIAVECQSGKCMTVVR
jgi:hypothetical protein